MSPAQRQSTRSEHEASTLNISSQRSRREENLVEEIKRQWRGGTTIDALEALRANPELQQHKSLVVDLAYEEFCLRRESGEEVDPEQFSGRFARYQASVRRRLEIHELLGSFDLVGLSDTSIWPVAGEVFAGFQLVEEIGHGAFARVFLATDPTLGNREVVLKVTAIAEREARLLGQLKHPNIVTVHSVKYDAESGLSAICMAFHGRATLCDLLDQSLAEESPRRLAGLLRRVAQAQPNSDVRAESRPWFGPSFEEQIVGLVAQIADALSYAHGRGIQHRDLKPSNILLDWSGRPMLLDFNLSVDPAEAHRNLGGTLPYMAPEMVAGISREVIDVAPEHGERADIFALGIVLYELLTGQVPFPPAKESAPTSLEDAAQQHLKNQRGAPWYPDDSVLARDSRLRALVERCVAFEPEGRPSSAAEVGHELRDWLSWRCRVRRWVVRHRVFVACCAAVLGGALACGAAWWWLRPPYAERASTAAVVAFRAGDEPLAAHLITAAIESGKRDAVTLATRGRIYQVQGKYGLAAGDYEEALELLPNAQVHAALAFCRAKEHYFDAAVYHTEQAIKLGFNTAKVWYVRGYAESRSGRTNQAIACFERAIELDPNCQPAWIGRASAHLNHSFNTSNVPQRAMVDIEQALAIGPDTGQTRLLAATIYAKAAELDPQWVEAALDHLKAAVELGLDPGGVEHDPRFGALRSDPRFAALCRHARMPAARFASPTLQDPLGDRTLPEFAAAFAP
ncbi:MAG: protein kinase [Pirellulales bacterium]|nr:protein kinase [Pirellulales bacterium]